MDPLQQPPLLVRIGDFSNCLKYKQQTTDQSPISQYVDDSPQYSGMMPKHNFGSSTQTNCVNIATESIGFTQQSKAHGQEGCASIQQFVSSTEFTNPLMYDSPGLDFYNQLPAISEDDICIDINDLEVSDDEMSDFAIESISDSNFVSGSKELLPPFDNTTVSILPFHDISALEFERQECVTSKTNNDEIDHHLDRVFKKQPLLSQFLMNALENPAKFSSMIKWIDRDKGIFEFISENKEELAKQWGEIKQNRSVMTYQKMSRALRIYIKKEKVIRKMRQKLQYVFREEFLHSELQRISNEMRE